MYDAPLAAGGGGNYSGERTECISLITQRVFTFAVALWAACGFLLNNWHILYSNCVTLVFVPAILIWKVRHPCL